ncbi:MAG TPA: hypothetical protein VM266_15800, partial [Solirubrobacteraceae bacterium]|nr:hypothetical protein [Solirubrobacteraceae bacterium]
SVSRTTHSPDDHSWVEAWFDGIGWVTFDPSPTPTPRAGADPGARRPEGLLREPGAAAAERERARGGGGLPLALLAAALLAGAGGLRWWWRRRARGGAAGRAPSDPGLAELERALRRSGRAAPPGTTLAQLERRLGASAEGAAYLRALRASRYGTAPAPPTRAQRAAFRRELAAGLGWRGRLRALWALPPAVRLHAREPR